MSASPRDDEQPEKHGQGPGDSLGCLTQPKKDRSSPTPTATGGTEETRQSVCRPADRSGIKVTSQRSRALGKRGPHMKRQGLCPSRRSVTSWNRWQPPQA